MVTMNQRGHVEVRCDRCLAAPVTALGIRTWASRNAALVDLLGPELSWEAADGRVLCGRCVREARCAGTGHRYGPWSSISGSALAARECTDCHHEDHAPSHIVLGAHAAAS